MTQMDEIVLNCVQKFYSCLLLPNLLRKIILEAYSWLEKEDIQACINYERKT